MTYWFTVGDLVVHGMLQARLAELGIGLTERIPDDLLFSASSIDPDRSRANRLQDQFINQLLHAVSPSGA